METITLGRNPQRQFPVVAQSHARLRHYLSETEFKKLLSREYAQPGYRLLWVLIPAIREGVKDPSTGKTVVPPMPEWEFEGYASPEAFEKGEYLPDKDNAPDTAQIGDALEAAYRQSGAAKLTSLFGVALEAQKQLTSSGVGGQPLLPPPAASNGQVATPISPVSPGAIGG